MSIDLVAVGWFTRSLRPYDPTDITPNPNDPASVPPSTVGPDQLVTPGDPHGVTVEDPGVFAGPPPTIVPSAWSGWPAGWYPPQWNNGQLQSLTDTAWMCLDYNSSIFAAMPPYLVDAAPTLSADWLLNPDPDQYSSWVDFARELFWSYQGVGEAYVYATARYSTGYPVRFHVLPAWSVEAEIGPDGLRRFKVGETDITPDTLQIRYQSTVGDAHGHGPLEIGSARMVAGKMLHDYAYGLIGGGGIPSSILKHPLNLSPQQAQKLQADWVAARQSRIGEPAVLSGGITWEATQLSPADMALTDLSTLNDTRIANLLKIPGPLVGLPTAGESLTYNTVLMALIQHWRVGLRPMAQTVMSALSGWLLPRGTSVEVNRDEYIAPEPLERAQAAATLFAIVDEEGNRALTVEEIRAAERLDNSTPEVGAGVLR